MQLRIEARLVISSLRQVDLRRIHAGEERSGRRSGKRRNSCWAPGEDPCDCRVSGERMRRAMLIEDIPGRRGREVVPIADS